jgi:hypothetical protein
LLLFTAPAFGAEDKAEPRFVLELEAGPFWQSRNDIQIPNTQEGTRFSLVDVVGRGPWPAGRIYATWNINPKHGLRALAAPLSITETGILPAAILFEGEKFDPGLQAEATYKFNSYRLTYRYRFHEGSRFDWSVGFTAKIRDAKVELRQAGKTARKTDVGFVPLLHVHGQYRLADSWRLILDVDALAGGPGRAEDASLKLCADISKRWSVAAGYRTIEGGADVESVYSFAWLHYAVVSTSFRF